MSKRQPKSRPVVGVIGAGSFGITVAQLLAVNNQVLLFARDPQIAQKINETHVLHDVNLSPRIVAVSSYSEIADTCEVIFPVVPSEDFRAMMKNLGPMLSPRHILIHGTKGLDTTRAKNIMSFTGKLGREDVCTMSEVIAEECN